MSISKIIPFFAVALVLAIATPASAKSAVKTPTGELMTPKTYKVSVRDFSYSVSEWALIRPIIVIPSFAHPSTVDLE